MYKPGRRMDRKIALSRVCKVVLLGDAGSGKTCLLERFLHDTFDSNTKPTIGAAFGNRTLDTPDGAVSLQIWDTAGQERYLALANLYYRNANAAVVCCDLTDLKSFQRMEYWIKQIKNAEKNCKIYVCGTKADLIWDSIKCRAITSADMKIFQTTTFETSSKISYNVFTLFQQLANDLEPSQAVNPIARTPYRSVSLPAETVQVHNRFRCCQLS